MKILLVNVLYYPLTVGGAEITIQNLAQGLLDRGHIVNVLTFTDKRQIEENIDGIKVFREPIPNVYLPYFKDKERPNILLRRLWHFIDIYNPFSKKIFENHIDKKKPDVIIFDNIQGFSPSIWNTSFSKNIPTVQVLHDLYLLCPTNMFKNNQVCKNRCSSCKIIRIPHIYLSNNLTAIVGVSKFILNKYLSYGYFKKVHFKEVIYNSRRDGKAVKKSIRQYDGNIHFGFIGNIAPNKGIEILLKAYLKIKSNNTKIFIAGSGEINYVKYLQDKYKDKSIVWLGWVQRNHFFEMIDFTIVPSIWYEPLGMVVIESFSYGVPVIASNIGGIPEMIKEGENGLLFEPGNVNEIAEKLAHVYENIKFWKNRYLDIQKSAECFLDYEGWIDKWEGLLNSIIKNGKTTKL
ncbi:MAG: glycosyltransferase family 4 protein [Acidobacterium ailaaui]|nr:glycosyltransferase family 4 protein [Pseudacidobacterium ailaaui]